MALTMTPTRQPFANLDSPRFHALTSSKLNVQSQQNGLSMSPKNQHQHQPEKDTENIDPSISSAFKQPPKRKRHSDADVEKDSPKPTKTTRTTQTTPRTTTPTPTPIPFSLFNPPSTPKSAPVPALKPAGRSPQSQTRSCKPFARRSGLSSVAKSREQSLRTNTNTNANANANTKKKRVLRPFSLATALSNGKPAPASNPSSQLKPKSQTNAKAPASWFFDIHVDAEEEEMTNLMQHSTCVLDISDDEDGRERAAGYGNGRVDRRGKENIPPAEMGGFLPGPVAAPVSFSSGSGSGSGAGPSRKAVTMEDERKPLGELNAADFYSEGCHAFSYAVVHDGDGDGSENVPDAKRGPEKTAFSVSHSRRSSGLQNVSSIEGVLDSAPMPVGEGPSAPCDVGDV